MKSNHRLLIRKIRREWIDFAAFALIIGVGVGFFAVVQSIVISYDNRSEAYYAEQKLPDLIVDVNAPDVNAPDDHAYGKTKANPDVEAIVRRMTIDSALIERDAKLRVLIADDPQAANIPYVLESDDTVSDGCYILKRNADALSLSVGDTISFNYGSQPVSVPIRAICTIPEYVYLAQDINIPIANSDEFCVILMSAETAQKYVDIQYDQWLILKHPDADANALSDEIKTALGDRCRRVVMQDNILSYVFFQDDLAQFSSFSVIFPVVFFFVGAVVLFVLLRRDVARERRQIGVKKALGLSDAASMRFYLEYAALACAVGCLLAIFLSVTIGNRALGIFAEMFEIPHLELGFFPGVWAIGIAAAFIVSLSAALSGASAILKIRPAEAMREETPAGGRRLLLERMRFFWNFLSLNTRYSLKSLLRSKGRFFTSIVGVSGSALLLVFAFGFNDSIEHVTSGYYENLIRYDARIEISPMLLSDESEIERIRGVAEYEKVLMAPVILTNQETGVEKELKAVISDEEVSMLNVKTVAGDSVDPGDGIVMPEYTATRMGLKIGDSVLLKTFDSAYEQSFRITDLSDQNTDFCVFLRYESITDMFQNNAKICNTLLLNYTEEDVLSKIEDCKSVTSVTTKEESIGALSNLLDTIDLMVSILLLFAVALGITVLFSVNTMSILSRRYEFSTLKVLGYSTGSILLVFLKESILQTVISIPVGFFLGVQALQLIKGDFSTDSFRLVIQVSALSFVYAFLAVCAMTGIMFLYTKRAVGKYDLVEILKRKE